MSWFDEQRDVWAGQRRTDVPGDVAQTDPSAPAPTLADYQSNLYEQGGIAGGKDRGPLVVDAPTGGDPQAQTNIAAQAAPQAAGGGGGYASFAGFDASKFGQGNTDPGSKYAQPGAGVYSQAIGSGVNFDRGKLDGLIAFAQSKGLNARAVGDDKVDFGDGWGPIDVVKSDGTKVFQNTTGNPVWEQAARAGAFGAGAQQMMASRDSGAGGGPAPSGGGPIGDPRSMGGGGWNAGGGGQPASRTYEGPDFVAQNIAAPTPYTPQDIAAPDAWQQSQIDPALAAVGPAVAARGVTGAGPVTAQQVQGPQAITAQQLAAANPYQATTEADLRNDPGYALRQKNTLAAMQQSAAMKGLLRTGGTVYDLGKAAGDLSSEEFANVDTRRFRDYSTDIANRVAIGNANNANAFQAYGLTNQYQQQAALANQQAGLSADTFNTQQANAIAEGNANRALTSDTFNSGQQTQGNQFNAAQTNTARGQNVQNSLAAWQAYQGMRQNASQFNAARTDTAAQNNFANNFSVAQANNANQLNAFNSNVNAKLGFGNLDLGYTRAGNDFSLGQGNLALGNRQADQSYDLGLRGNALGYLQANNAFTLGNQANQLGWANYGLNEQGQGFNQAYTLANFGLQATGALGGYTGTYGANAADNATQAGNAQAAGRVGSANAWNAGLTGAANGAANAWALWNANRQHPMTGGQ